MAAPQGVTALLAIVREEDDSDTDTTLGGVNYPAYETKTAEQYYDDVIVSTDFSNAAVPFESESFTKDVQFGTPASHRGTVSENAPFIAGSSVPGSLTIWPDYNGLERLLVAVMGFEHHDDSPQTVSGDERHTIYIDPVLNVEGWQVGEINSADATLFKVRRYTIVIQKADGVYVIRSVMFSNLTLSRNISQVTINMDGTGRDLHYEQGVELLSGDNLPSPRQLIEPTHASLFWTAWTPGLNIDTTATTDEINASDVSMTIRNSLATTDQTMRTGEFIAQPIRNDDYTVGLTARLPRHESDVDTWRTAHGNATRYTAILDFTSPAVVSTAAYTLQLVFPEVYFTSTPTANVDGDGVIDAAVSLSAHEPKVEVQDQASAAWLYLSFDPGADSINALNVHANKLWALGRDDRKVYSFDGTTWSTGSTVYSASGASFMAWFEDALYVGTDEAAAGSNELVSETDPIAGVTWATVSGAGALEKVTGLESYGGLLWVCYATTSEELDTWDGSSFATDQGPTAMNGQTSASDARLWQANGLLYYAVLDTTLKAFSYDGTTWSTLTVTPTAAATAPKGGGEFVHPDGTVEVWMYNVGLEMFKLTGSTFAVIQDLTGTAPVRAANLAQHQGRLWVGSTEASSPMWTYDGKTGAAGWTLTALAASSNVTASPDADDILATASFRGDWYYSDAASSDSRIFTRRRAQAVEAFLRNAQGDNPLV